MKLFTHAGAILAEPVLPLCHILKIVSIAVPQQVMQVRESEFKICSIWQITCLLRVWAYFLDTFAHMELRAHRYLESGTRWIFVPSFPAETLLHSLFCVRCLGLKTLSNQFSLWAQFEWVLNTVIDLEMKREALCLQELMWHHWLLWLLLARGEDAFKLFQKDSGAFQMVSLFSSAGAAPFFSCFSHWIYWIIFWNREAITFFCWRTFMAPG